MPSTSLVAIDLDNCLACRKCGYDRIDIAKLCGRARAEFGPDCNIRVFANGMKQRVATVWQRHGAEIVRSYRNADPLILDFLLSHRDAPRVGIVSGDWIFARAAHFHRRLGHHVTVWARRSKVAAELAFAADKLEFCIDDLLLGPAHSPATVH
jgi:hypothetical protein